MFLLQLILISLISSIVFQVFSFMKSNCFVYCFAFVLTYILLECIGNLEILALRTRGSGNEKLLHSRPISLQWRRCLRQLSELNRPHELIARSHPSLLKRNLGIFEVIAPKERRSVSPRFQERFECTRHAVRPIQWKVGHQSQLLRRPR